MKCPNCGHNLSDTARFCNKCGQPVQAIAAKQPKKDCNEHLIKCPHCDQSLPDTAKFCNKCGQPVQVPLEKFSKKQNDVHHTKHLNFDASSTNTAEFCDKDKKAFQTEDKSSVERNQEKPQTAELYLTPKESAEKKKNKNKIFIVIIILTILLVLVSSAIWFVVGRRADDLTAAFSHTESVQEQNIQEPEKSQADLEQNSEGPKQNQAASSIESESLAGAENSEDTKSILVEEWGQQEILIMPKDAGMADLVLRQEHQGTWVTLFECEAAIGRNGTTDSPTEGDGKTPAGTFAVLFCYGLEQPQTGIPFVKLTSDNVWVDDSESEYYNCLTTRQNAGTASYEDTYSQFTRGYYSYNIFFANNGDGRTPGSATPGLGSVRVLEGYLKTIEPTNGDIKISAQDMENLLGMLHAQYNPVVTVVE